MIGSQCTALPATGRGGDTGGRTVNCHSSHIGRVSIADMCAATHGHGSGSCDVKMFLWRPLATSISSMPVPMGGKVSPALVNRKALDDQFTIGENRFQRSHFTRFTVHINVLRKYFDLNENIINEYIPREISGDGSGNCFVAWSPFCESSVSVRR